MSRKAPRRRAEPVRRRARRDARRERATTPAPAPVPTPVIETTPEAPVPTPPAPAPAPERPAAPVVAEPTLGAAPRRTRAERFARSRWPLAIWSALVALGAGILLACLFDHGQEWACAAGSITIATAYAWALAVRTGGRPVVAGVLGLGLGLGSVLSGEESLRTGAAVLTCVVASVLAVMSTVPAVRFVAAVREVGIALLIAAIGALAVIGFEPAVAVLRFEYVTLGLAFVGTLALVYRLGAGLHGLGRRGFVIVLLGSAVLALTLAYAELLRRYGTPEVVDRLLEGVVWSREHVGAFPRPLETVLGVPALVWGVHMRARRRQGWWVCAFGVAATAPVAAGLVNPAVSLSEAVLSVGYGAVVGLVLGFVVIRLDLAFTAPRGRRGRRAEEAGAVRPEPRRTRGLL